ncbi:MAG: hypothetical protein ACRDY1_05875 [Acidimicrobiales bacterium]
MAARRITLVEMAPAVGTSAHTLGRVTNGHVEPWPALRQKVADFLGLPVDEAWRGS